MSDPLKLTEHAHAPRMPIRLQIVYESLDEFLIDYTSNVSLGGIFITTREPLAKGTRFRLRVRIPVRRKPIETVATVNWSVPPSEGSSLNPGMGVQYDPVYPEDLRFIQQLLDDFEEGEGRQAA